jgi:hypothetical protein
MGQKRSDESVVVNIGENTLDYDIPPEVPERGKRSVQSHDIDNRPLPHTPSVSSQRWNIFGKNVARPEVQFICHVILLYVVVLSCIINLSLPESLSVKENQVFWATLLGTAIGALLPNPKIKKEKK